MHRRYVPYSHAHYAGNLVDGAYSLGLFGDVATEMCIRTDGDEGLFASYSDVQFRQPVRAGDVLEVTAELVRVGTRSRVMDFTPERRRPRQPPPRPRPVPPAMLAEPLVATTATGTVVVPPAARAADAPHRRVARDTPAARRKQSREMFALRSTPSLTCAFTSFAQVRSRLTGRRRG